MRGFLSITGAVGTGKSLFIRRFKELLQSDVERQNTLWAFIDFNSVEGQVKTAQNWMCEKFLESFAEENQYDAYEAANWPQVFSVDLKRRKAIYDDIALSSHEQARMARATDLNQWIADPKKLAFGLTRHFCGERRATIVAVMDNTDRLSSEEQLDVFNLALWFMDQSRSFVVLNLRDETYERFKNVPPLDTYKSGISFHISPPLFADVVRRRLELGIRHLAANTPDTLEYSTANGIRFKYANSLLGEFLKEMYIEIFERQPNSARLIQGLSGRDLRDALIVFESILRSGHLSEESITSKVRGAGQFEVKEDVILRALMRGDYRLHSAKSAYIKNIFLCGHTTKRPNNFLIVDTLYWLNKNKRRIGHLGLEGYHTVDCLTDEMQLCGYLGEDVISVSNELLSDGLIEADSFGKQLAGPEASIRISFSGFIHLRLLVSRFEYIYGILPTTQVFDRSKAQEIAIVINREMVDQDVSMPMKIRAVRVLISHLEECFQSNLAAFPAFGGVETGAYYAMEELRKLDAWCKTGRDPKPSSNIIDSF